MQQKFTTQTSTWETKALTDTKPFELVFESVFLQGQPQLAKTVLQN